MSGCLLNAWREAPVFSERERAALGWVDAVTRIADTHVPDDVYEAARQQFSEKELVDLTAAVVAINAWIGRDRVPRHAAGFKTAKIAA
jgi:alkylhydroperoxidase family enzyme